MTQQDLYDAIRNSVTNIADDPFFLKELSRLVSGHRKTPSCFQGSENDKFLFPQNTLTSDSDFSSSDTDSMFLKSASKQSRASENNLGSWVPTKSDQARRRTSTTRNVYGPPSSNKGLNFAFADRVNLQDMEKKVQDHRRNITERQFIFEDSDEDDNQGMTTPRRARPNKGFLSPLPLDLAKAECSDSGKLRFKHSEDRVKTPETPVMFPNMIKEMPMPVQLMFEDTTNTISSIQPSPIPSPKHRNSNNIQLISRELFYTLC